MHNHGVSPEIWTVVPVDADSVPTEAIAAVSALSPAVVEELRQMWRADARDEAKTVVRENRDARPAIVEVSNTISTDSANAMLADGWELIGVRTEHGPLYILGLPLGV